MFPLLLEARPTELYKLNLRYDDNTQGVVDLSHLSGRGVFKKWTEKDFFFNVKIDPETNALVWNDAIDLDPDSLYLEIRGISFEEFKARPKPQTAYAAN
jgi:hypothetical protein